MPHLTKAGKEVTIVRPTAWQHADELYELIDRSREHLKNLAWAADVPRSAVHDHCLKPNVWIIRVDGEAAGCIELRAQPDGWSQVGYWVGEGFAGQGVAKQALALAILGGYIGQHLFACVRQGNIRSRTVLGANGFSVTEMDDEWMRFTRIVGTRAGTVPTLARPMMWDNWSVK